MMRLTLEASTERFINKFSTSAELTEAATNYIPGGSGRSIVKVGPHPIFVESGEGA